MLNTYNAASSGTAENCLTGREDSIDIDFDGSECLDFQWVQPSRATAALVAEINDFVDGQDTSHPFQLPQWSGNGSRWALFRSQGRIRCFAQCGLTYPAGRLLRPVRALIVNHGPLCGDPRLFKTALRMLVQESQEMGIAYIDITPEWSGALAHSAGELLVRDGWQPLSNPRSTLRLDLSPSLDDLLGGFRKTTRYEIRRSAESVEVTLARDATDHKEFLRLYREMADQREFPAESSEFVLPILRWLASEHRRGGLFLARENGILRGGVVVVRCGIRCWYVWGATSKAGKLSAGHRLQWCAIQWAKENGCREYDFGGFREDASGGPALFKRGFCYRVVHFIEPHRYILSRPRLRAAEIASRLRIRDRDR